MSYTKLRNIALVVALCHFMEMLDATIITTAIPSISNYFHISTSFVSMAITAYITALAVCIPISGWMAVRFNVKKIFLAAIFIFTIASLGCALSSNFLFLILMRVLQGIGGAMMFPVGRLIVLQQTEKKDLILMISFLVWPGLIAPAIAPLIGGLIVTYASWHWIFLINVPIGIIAFILSQHLFDDSKGDPTISLDWKGVILISIGAGGLVIASEILSDAAASWELGIILFTFFFIEILFALYYLKRISNPLINLSVLKYKTFRISQTGGSLFWFSVGSAPYLLTLLFQNQFGWSPTFAGSIVLFIFFGNVSIKPASTYLLNHFGFKKVFMVSIIVVIISMLISSAFSKETPIIILIIVTTLSGMGRSLTLTSYNTISFSELNPEETRAANTLASTTQNMAQAVGIAITSIALHIGNIVFNGGKNPGIEYKFTFILLAFFAFLALLEILLLPKKLGNSILRKN
ncbi:major facilitator superfamily MFS_1 [Clostridium sp. DL-VIII]|uniref:MFS transporter n=1 Tax=Clostridium sp. DL-VIII TaxID=641107 RepID=UPI00023B0893|nr:MFS transporter [Clostridium sp. DL-VIII]EHJ01166.1 major facilitator superfamily MFS_1 [Clostridium sp. DL-VIII]